MHQLTGPIRPVTLVRLAMPFVILAGCMWLLSGIIEPELLTELPSLLRSVPADALMLSAVLCFISFWAVARYDEVAHRHFKTGIDPRAARHSGFAAIALGQTLGFGIFTGAVVRWRVLSGIEPLQALRLSSFAALTFMPGLFFLTALTTLLFLPMGWWTVPALLATVVLPLLVAALSFSPTCAALRSAGFVPSLRAIGAILCWTAFDIVAAAGAFYLLIPTAGLGFELILPVFLIALSAALLSGSPGGVGPFEIVLIALLPQVPMADLLVAIICFRALYYAVPAVLAVTYLLRPFRVFGASEREPRAYADAYPAEMGILAQNNGSITALGSGALGLLSTDQTLTQLFDPINLPLAEGTAHLTQLAEQENKLPLIYKCTPATAAKLRKQHWKVCRTAKDAIIEVASYDLATPSRRRLRRALRQAEAAQVRVLHAVSLPISQMAQLDSAWQARHGCAQGTTMGRFCPHYVAQQEVFLAYQGSELVAFASFHRDAQSLCLDLLRHADEIPQGTMHALVEAGIALAKSRKLRAVSLAAVPAFPDAWLFLPYLRRRCDRAGLYQFKNSFAPHWHPRYAAAPSRIGLVIGLADITLAVHFPAALAEGEQTHNQDEDYEVALNRVSCEGKTS